MSSWSFASKASFRGFSSITNVSHTFKFQSSVGYVIIFVTRLSVKNDTVSFTMEHFCRDVNILIYILRYLSRYYVHTPFIPSSRCTLTENYKILIAYIIICLHLPCGTFGVIIPWNQIAIGVLGYTTN